MRSAVRVALSSYVVITACNQQAAPAPEPSFSVVQSGSPMSRVTVVRQVRLGMASGHDADSLSVKLGGPSAVRTAGTASFTAVVQHGALEHYYYWWFVANCATYGGCSPTSYVPVGEGEDLTTVTLPFGAETAEKDVVVQVAEIDGDGRTGSSVEFPVMGPARRQGDGEGFGGTVCDWYAGTFYPHLGTYVDPFTGRSWKRRFRRDYCGNRVSWKPAE